MFRLKELRTEKRISLRELADNINISYSSLGKYEREEQEPNIDNLIKIANYFEVSVDYLIGNSSFKTKKDEQYFISSIEQPKNNNVIEIYNRIINCLNKAEQIYDTNIICTSRSRLDDILIRELFAIISDYEELFDAIHDNESIYSLYQIIIANNLSHNYLEVISDAVISIFENK